MLSSKQFDMPTKIHFASPDGSEIGSIFVDCVMPHPGGTSFYFGQSCVAILTEDYLMIGPRQMDRSGLSEVEPFWSDSTETVEVIADRRSSKAELRASK